MVVAVVVALVDSQIEEEFVLPKSVRSSHMIAAGGS